MGIVLGRSAVLVSQRSRHAEVDQEHTTRFEPNNQILAAPLDGGDDLAFELCSDFPWLAGPGHAGVEDLDAIEAPADEDGLEAGTNRLDLGQLGHGASLAAALAGRSTRASRG